MGILQQHSDGDMFYPDNLRYYLSDSFILTINSGTDLINLSFSYQLYAE